MSINLVSFLVLTCLGVFLVRSHTLSVKSAMESKVTGMLDFLSTASRPYLVNFDIYAIDGFAKQAILDSDIVYVRFLRGDQVLTEARDESLSQTSEVKSLHRKILDKEGKELAQLELGYSLDRINQSINEIILIDAFIIICEQFAVLLGVILIVRMLMSPLRRLKQSLREVAENRNVELSLAEQPEFKNGAIEFQILADEYDRMRTEILRQNKEIGENQKILEKTVEERTQELRKTIESLHSAQQALVQTSKFSALGEMAAGIAHEINNPLTIIRMLARQIIIRGQNSGANAHQELTKESGLDGDNQAQSQVQAESALKIQASVDRIAKIIKGLVSFSRESKSDPFQLESLSDIMSETLSFCSERFRHHSIKLEIEPLDQSIKIFVRRGEVSQIFLNLLNNAFDATQTLQQDQRWVRVYSRLTDDKVQLVVVNGGPSIPPEIVSKIFDPFFTTKGVGQGTGLGLSISRGLAESNHGLLDLDLNSAHPCFVLSLPHS